jgi:hypothetical protein
MGMESTQHLTEMSTRYLPSGGIERPGRKADNLCLSTVYKMCRLRRLTNHLASTSFYRDSFNIPEARISILPVYTGTSPSYSDIQSIA